MIVAPGWPWSVKCVRKRLESCVRNAGKRRDLRDFSKMQLFIKKNDGI